LISSQKPLATNWQPQVRKQPCNKGASIVPEQLPRLNVWALRDPGSSSLLLPTLPVISAQSSLVPHCELCANARGIIDTGLKHESYF